MADAIGQINFNAPAELRKWPSLNGRRNDNAAFPGTYLVVEGTLDECIGQFISKPVSQRHLYEIVSSFRSWWILSACGAQRRARTFTWKNWLRCAGTTPCEARL